MKRAVLLSMLVSIAFALHSQHNNPDCSNAYIVCSNDPIAIQKLEGPGTENEIGSTNCTKGVFTKTNSIWFKWQIGVSGDLGFSIVPANEKDDLDFILYKMPNGVDDCGSTEEIRCMASGENLGILPKGGEEWQCLGATGLSIDSGKENGMPGCSSDSDNFLSSVQAKEGEAYALFVNNYYASGGFLLEFSGTAKMSSNIGDCQPTVIPTLSSDSPEVTFSNVFPNPASSELILPVKAMKPFEDGVVQLTSLHGDLLKTQYFDLSTGAQNIKIQIGELPIGVYFVKATIEGNTHITRFSKF